MKKIVFATANPHKIDELKAIAKAEGIKGIKFVMPPKGFDPKETGETFEENSYIKAKEAHKLTKTYCLADDSGLCVEALDNKPGIYSARYADSPQERIDKLLNELKPHNNRSAKFICSMTLLNENGHIIYNTRGECRGQITHNQSGVNGFGYDPVFKPENSEITMAEMCEKEKNEISHRGRALRNVLHFLVNAQ